MLGCRIFVPPEGAANRGPKESPELCARIKDSVYKRPDPMIYSQPFLGSQGLAVTWDNPDIHLERNGVVVNSSSLSPATEYDIVARIWNGSNIAPAIDFPVTFSYLEFGSKKTDQRLAALGVSRSPPVAHLSRNDLPGTVSRPQGGWSRSLTAKLRTGRPLRKRRRKAAERTPRFIAPALLIHRRPPIVETRTRIGDWEGDLIVGKHSRSEIGTLVDRTSRAVCPIHLPSVIALSVGHRGIAGNRRRSRYTARGTGLSRPHQLSRES